MDLTKACLVLSILTVASMVNQKQGCWTGLQKEAASGHGCYIGRSSILIYSSVLLHQVMVVAWALPWQQMLSQMIQDPGAVCFLPSIREAFLSGVVGIHGAELVRVWVSGAVGSLDSHQMLLARLTRYSSSIPCNWYLSWTFWFLSEKPYFGKCKHSCDGANKTPGLLERHFGMPSLGLAQPQLIWPQVPPLHELGAGSNCQHSSIPNKISKWI